MHGQQNVKTNSRHLLDTARYVV